MKIIFTKFYVLIVLVFVIFYSFSLSAHSGMTGPTGCHMNYYTAEYHCHQKKQPNYLQTYWYINWNFNKYGPYSSYSSCMNAARGAGLTGYFCTNY